MHLHKRKTSDKNVLNIGDVVVVKLGRVESLFLEQDKCVRDAKLTTTSGEGRRIAISRLIQIIPFEIVFKSSQNNVHNSRIFHHSDTTETSSCESTSHHQFGYSTPSQFIFLSKWPRSRLCQLYW